MKEVYTGGSEVGGLAEKAWWSCEYLKVVLLVILSLQGHCD